MPFTPFHFGPGLFVHASEPRRISFVAFCATNVLIDLESLYHLLLRHARVHAFFHTYLGATFVAIDALLLFALLRWMVDVAKPPWNLLVPMPWPAAWGALLGAWSHVLLDSVMHSDLTPLAPFSYGNPLFVALPLRQLHGWCVAAGLMGVAVLGFRRWRSSSP